MIRHLYAIALLIVLSSCSKEPETAKSLEELIAQFDKTIQENDFQNLNDFLYGRTDTSTQDLTKDETKLFKMILDGLAKSDYKIEVIPYFPKLPESQSMQPEYFLRVLSKKLEDDDSEPQYSLFAYIDEKDGEYFPCQSPFTDGAEPDHSSLRFSLVVSNQKIPGLRNRRESPPNSSRSNLNYKGYSMNQLAEDLSDQFALTIEDETKITGYYDFKMNLQTSPIQPSELQMELRKLGLDLLLKNP